jgi:hypothetical protein
MDEAKGERFSPFDNEPATTLHIAVSERLKRELDAEARRREINRSALCRQLLTAGLEKKGGNK